MFNRFFRTRNVVAIVLIVILMVVAGAFAAANVVPETGAGDGEGDITGYTVSNISYTLDTVAPFEITTVSFDTTPTFAAGPATTVIASLNGTPVSCIGGGGTWACDFSGLGVTAALASTFRVVAAQ